MASRRRNGNRRGKPDNSGWIGATVALGLTALGEGFKIASQETVIDHQQNALNVLTEDRDGWKNEALWRREENASQSAEVRTLKNEETILQTKITNLKGLIEAERNESRARDTVKEAKIRVYEREKNADKAIIADLRKKMKDLERPGEAGPVSG